MYSSILVFELQIVVLSLLDVQARQVFWLAAEKSFKSGISSCCPRSFIWRQGKCSDGMRRQAEFSRLLCKMSTVCALLFTLLP